MSRAAIMPLAAAAQRDEMRHMTGLVDEPYPSFRWFLYDGLGRYTMPLGNEANSRDTP